LLEPYVRRVREIPQDEITERLFLPMLLEATRLLEAGVVRDVRDVDLGLIYGLGFPADRGGLLFWADSLGTARVVAMLESHAPLGSRFQPTPWLLDMARRRPELLRRRAGRSSACGLEDGMSSAVVVDCVRTAIGRSHAARGVFRRVRSEQLAAACLNAADPRTGSIRPRWRTSCWAVPDRLASRA
jgi:hypothetical protein